MNDSQWLSFIFYRITYIKFLLSKNTYYKTYTHKYYKPRYFNEENILNFQVIDIDTHTDNINITVENNLLACIRVITYTNYLYTTPGTNGENKIDKISSNITP